MRSYGPGKDQRQVQARPAPPLGAASRTESIILDLNTSVYYSLNDTGAFIWERLGSGATAAEISTELCAEFDVKPDAAARDADELIAKLSQEKLLLPA